MTTLADNMRAIRPWQILVLVVAPFIVAGMVYGAYTVATRDADDDLAEDQQLIPVQRGDLVNDVSISGSLAYSEREILMFGSQGTLGRIEVEEGQTVAANEVLATLDAASIGSLEKAVAEAEVELQDAQGALDALEEPPTPLEVANAELKVANALLGLTEAVETVETLRKPTASDIAKAEAAVANAELDLEEALEAVEALRKADRVGHRQGRSGRCRGPALASACHGRRLRLHGADAPRDRGRSGKGRRRPCRRRRRPGQARHTPGEPHAGRHGQSAVAG